jgi:hypothetical protein
MKKALLILLMSIAVAGMAQRIQNFYGFTAGSSVGLRFTITKGPQCSGYTIYHSVDSINFIQIYDYTGICGDVSSNQEISYTHTSPQLNQTNYYKVEIFSPYEVSPIARVYVGNGTVQPRMLLYPNPVTTNYDLLNIQIFNVSNIRMIGFLYNQFGKPIREYDLTTKLDLTSIGVYDLENGLYVLWLTDGFQVYSAKFIINR